MEAIEKDKNGSINEESVEEDDKDTIGATAMGATGITGITEKDSQNNNEKLNIETEEATNMGVDTEVIGGSGLQQHVKRFHEEGAAAARKEEMEEKKEQKINEDNIENNR